MTTPLLGDPASMSSLGASLRRAAVRLAEDGSDLHTAVEDASPGWRGPRSVSLRRRATGAAEQAATVAGALDDVGRSLQAAATELSTTIARLRELQDAAAALGLEVRDGTVTQGWGITGVADAAAVRDEDDQRARLQDGVHHTVTALGRHRARLTGDLERAADLLTRASAQLRR